MTGLPKAEWRELVPRYVCQHRFVTINLLDGSVACAVCEELIPAQVERDSPNLRVTIFLGKTA